MDPMEPRPTSNTSTGFCSPPDVEEDILRRGSNGFRQMYRYWPGQQCARMLCQGAVVRRMQDLNCSTCLTRARSTPCRIKPTLSDVFLDYDGT